MECILVLGVLVNVARLPQNTIPGGHCAFLYSIRSLIMDNLESIADLRAIYTAATVEEAEQHLAAFEAKWDQDYPAIGQSWRRNWARITPFFDYPPEIRRVIYTTNAIESLNMSLRKITKNRGSFPSDEPLLKLFYLAQQNISKKWTMPIRDWKAALNRFTIQFGDRMPQH